MHDITVSPVGASAYRSSATLEMAKAAAARDDISEAEKLVRRFLRRRMEGSIDDACQESITRALATSSKFSGNSSFSTYLLGIAVNVSREQGRAKRRGRRIRRSDVDAIADVAEPPDLAIARESERHQLLAAFSALPAEYRDVLHMYYWDGSSAATIGRLIGAREGTVRSRIRRAKELLRLALRARARGARRSQGGGSRTSAAA